MRVTIKPWPNGLGFDATVNRTSFEMRNPDLGEGYIATQTRKAPGTLCGYEGLRWQKIGESHLDQASAALVAYAELKARPENWTPCEG